LRRRRRKVKKEIQNKQLIRIQINKNVFLNFLVFSASSAKFLRLLRPYFCISECSNSSNRRFVSARAALVVHPRHFHFVASFAAFECELREWVFRHCWPPLGAEDGFAGVFGFDGLDEVCGHDFAISGAALAGFHFVAHEHAHGGFVALHLGADSHRIRHDFSPEFR
jgi:hypothetical protein